MNILVFKTVNEKGLKALLKEIDTLHNDFYIIVPEDEIRLYESVNADVHYIRTEKKYMDYETLVRENRIPNILFHEIWVLSSTFERIYNCGDAYAVISELRERGLKDCEMYYKVINGEKIETYTLGREIFFPKIYNFGINIVKVYAKLLHLFEKNIKGYRW